MIRPVVALACAIAGLASLAALAPRAEAPGFTPVGGRIGGEAGRPAFGQSAFALPAPGLDARQLRDFAFGNRLFNTNWVIAGSSTKSFDGLGPLFNRVSCSGCHVRDGRGQPPSAGEPMESMLVRISIAGANGQGEAHPVYGDQIQDRAIPGVEAEARVDIEWEEIPGQFADGEPFSLRRPTITISSPAYGAIGEVLTSARVAQGMVGLGLLEAIPEETLLALADPDDRDGDGISGRVNRVWDIASQDLRLGRFGWKANQPSLRQQVSAAASGDIGITNPLVTSDACTSAQVACRESVNGGEPEMSERFLDKLVLYNQSLAVPDRRQWDTPEARRGEQLFHEAGCAACHVPTLRTGSHDIAAISQQTIHPFTDLLLHDMGEGLSDGRPDFDATGREWRTTPLWGIGLIETVNGHQFLLHDGRARGLAEAILWHGGEAESSRESFREMSKPQREALLAFLNSL